MPDPKNILKTPEGIAPSGPIDSLTDMTEVYVKAITSIPAYLQLMVDVLESIDNSLAVLSLYTEKKGLADGTLNPDDLETGDDDGPVKTN